MRYVTLSSTAITADTRAVSLTHKVMGGCVCLYWIGNVMRSSRSPSVEDVRHLGYDIVQIGKDLSMFRKIANSSLSRSSTQKKQPSAVPVFCIGL